MEFSDFLKTPAGWVKDADLDDGIVMTSRIRLARNVVGEPFPGWAKKRERKEILHKILPEVESLSIMKDAFSSSMHLLTSLQKQVLVEKHLISREQASNGEGSASVIDRGQAVGILINEEDHLRMQSICSGLHLNSAYKLLNEVDDELEQKLDYSFDYRLGYLTACPTNLGTGIRASVMLHLPALVLSKQINQVIQALTKIGLAVRGLYGEGTEAFANLFQVSNQTTLGDKETEIIKRLQNVVEQIIEHEKNARMKLLEDRFTMLCDQIGRAYAILSHAYIIPSKEALSLLSMIRLGTDLGFFPQQFCKTIDQLLIEIQPAHLQLQAEGKLSAEQRDVSRAKMMRDKLKSLPQPDIITMRKNYPDLYTQEDE